MNLYAQAINLSNEYGHLRISTHCESKGLAESQKYDAVEDIDDGILNDDLIVHQNTKINYMYSCVRLCVLNDFVDLNPDQLLNNRFADIAFITFLDKKYVPRLIDLPTHEWMYYYRKHEWSHSRSINHYRPGYCDNCHTAEHIERDNLEGILISLIEHMICR